nr:MAG TPA: G protein-regulated inducer of neurite outgrowth C-terminus [Caudoviricetes sp.]
MVCVSTLLCIVLGVKNVVWSRGKTWGVYGRQFLLRFSNHDPKRIYIYVFIP